MTGAALELRPAVAADRAAILRMLAELDPADYIPLVLDQWLQGGAFTAEHAGRLIGVFRISLPAPGEAYFSGMRIARSEHGKGYGQAFCRAQLELAHQLGCNTVYLLSEEHNAAAHRTVESNGFDRLGPWRIWHQETQLDQPVAGECSRVRSAELGDAPGMLRFLANHPLNGVAGICAMPEDPWTLRSFQGAELPDLVAEGSVALVPGSGVEPDGVMICGLMPGVPAGLHIRYLCGTPAAVTQLLNWAGGAVKQLGCGYAVLSLPGPQAEIVAATGLCQGPLFSAYAFVHHRHQSAS